ncbi:hypothetical protein [Acidocella facilis]|uniref:hypothetical protein n=1 Tax=Acidocella facilis TaxID=525 RepID=UPI0012DF24D0|nr:hypothetical protein [Acidocella facilis]
MPEIEPTPTTRAAAQAKPLPISRLPDERREAVESIICEMQRGLNLLAALDDEAELEAGSIKWAVKRLSEQAEAALSLLDPVTWSPGA